MVNKSFSASQKKINKLSYLTIIPSSHARKMDKSSFLMLYNNQSLFSFTQLSTKCFSPNTVFMKIFKRIAKLNFTVTTRIPSLFHYMFSASMTFLHVTGILLFLWVIGGKDTRRPRQFPLLQLALQLLHHQVHPPLLLHTQWKRQYSKKGKYFSMTMKGDPQAILWELLT